MLNLLAKSFMTATRTPNPEPPKQNDHQGPRTRFDARRDAEIEAHLTARRRD